MGFSSHSKQFRVVKQALILGCALLVCFGPGVIAEEAGQAGQAGNKAGKGSSSAPEPDRMVDKAATATAGWPPAPVVNTGAAGLKPVAADSVAIPAAAAPGPPEWHRLQMRLSGSMCIACLKDMEEHLKRLPGIDRTRIERPGPTFTQSLSPEISNWAQAVIILDTRRLAVDDLRNAIRENGYHSYRIVDRNLDREPEDHDLKF